MELYTNLVPITAMPPVEAAPTVHPVEAAPTAHPVEVLLFRVGERHPMWQPRLQVELILATVLQAHRHHMFHP